jgi:2,3-bisphosphoglycerate-dependent phosphoglycerate mutase
MNKTLYIVRHCEATGQSKESKLTKEGENQSLQLLKFFKDKSIDKIISSPYTRAMKSIEPLSKELNLKIHIDENHLKEY